MKTVIQTADLGDIMVDGTLKGEEVLRLGLGVLIIGEALGRDESPAFNYFIDLKPLGGTRYEITARLCESEADEREADQLKALLGDVDTGTDSFHFEARRREQS
jgi:hypothetical protein